MMDHRRNTCRALRLRMSLSCVREHPSEGAGCFHAKQMRAARRSKNYKRSSVGLPNVCPATSVGSSSRWTGRPGRRGSGSWSMETVRDRNSAVRSQGIPGARNRSRTQWHASARSPGRAVGVHDSDELLVVVATQAPSHIARKHARHEPLRGYPDWAFRGAVPCR